MAVLVFKNQELETDLGVRDLSSITNGLIYSTVPIPDVDIKEISKTNSFLFSSNNLICILDDGTPTGNRFGGPEIRVNGFWKITDTPSGGNEFSKYKRFETAVSVELFTPGRISIKILDSDKEDVEEAYRARGLPKPDYGMLVVVLNFVNKDGGQRKERAYLLKYTHNPLFSNNVNLGNIDFGNLFAPDTKPVKNVYRSPPYSAETFFIPKISSSFVYNFFEPQETDYDVYTSRDYKLQKISNVPKYIKLTWNKPSFDADRFEKENEPPPQEQFQLDESAARALTSNGGLLGLRGSNNPVLRSPPVPPPSPPSPRAPSAPTLSPSALRVGGVILSQGANLTELAGHMRSPVSRTGVQSAGVFDGSTRVVELSREAQTQLRNAMNVPNVVVDDFQTYSPRVLDLAVSVAKDSDYVGYVIEKARLTEDGQFEVVDIIAIPGKDTTEYIDWKIAYGESYRYKIRSVFRFVNKKNLSMFSDTDSEISRKQSVKYVDTNTLIQTDKTFYFDSVYSDPTEIQTTESERPNPPVSLRLFSKSKEKKIFITWNQKNQNRDVVGYNVYKKTLKNKKEPFIRINSGLIDVRENFFIDNDVEPDTEYIYAIESIDFHGNFSKLSAQYYIKIKNFVVDERVDEVSQKFFEVEGRELGETEEQEVPTLIVCKKNISINVNPLFKNTDENNTFVLRITSLDTGHKKEIKINFRTTTIYNKSGYAPARPQQFSPFVGAAGFFDSETLAKLVREFGNRK